MPDEDSTRLKIGELLLKNGLLLEESVQTVLEKQLDVSGRRKFGEIALSLNLLKEDSLVSSLSEQFGVPVINPLANKISEDLLSIFPKSMAKKYMAIPIDIVNDKVRVAMYNPVDLAAIDHISKLIKLRVEPFIASQSKIEEAINIYYMDGILTAKEDGIRYNADLLDDRSGIGIKEIFLSAVSVCASDIHFEPMQNSVAIKLRIDGDLVDSRSISTEIYLSISIKLKLISLLDISESRLPQDGGFEGSKVGIPDTEFRVATYPTVYGESIVVRIFYKNVDYNLEDLGLAEAYLAKFKEGISSKSGLVVVTGPTGSGKTTTLYSAIKSIVSPSQLIITVEEPVEQKIKGVRQSQVNRKLGFTFAKGLKHALRQDPNIIMIGEIRDQETAIAAIRAAMTGHLCISSMHTYDSLSVVERLLDLGIKRYQLGATLRLAMAQKLVRKLCKNCKGTGCDLCYFRGYSGRTAIFEVLSIDHIIRSGIRDGRSAKQLKEISKKSGAFLSFENDIKRKIDDKVTTLEEVSRVLDTTMM